MNSNAALEAIEWMYGYTYPHARLAHPVVRPDARIAYPARYC